MARRTRETELAPRMSEHEALMWNIEKDPWLNPSGGSVILLDRPLDMEHFRHQMRYGVSQTPRLFQRVVPGFGRMSTPAWVADAEFDLDAHIREIVLPAPGTQRQLFDLAAQLYSEPFDRTRPLWRYVVITGLENGGSAIWGMIHHSVSDGIGQMRMAELYQQLSRDLEPAPDVDLEGIIAEAVAAGAKESGGNLATSAAGTISQSASHVARRQFGIGRRVVGEVAMWPADPSRIADRASKFVDTVRDAVSALQSNDESSPGSPLWSNRSRHRHLEWVRVSVDDLKAAGAAFGGTINDVFMAALAEGAHRYHQAHGVSIEFLNSSFVLSTRKDSKAGGNAFTPVPVKLPAGKMSVGQRVRATVEVVEAAKERAQKTGGMTAVSGVANLLPISVVTQAARSAASHIDFSTSNLRGAPFPLYVSGAKVTATIAMGPVAGTGANITAMSYDGAFDMGIFLDPSAITDPEQFRTLVEESFADLFAASSSKKAATKKSAPKRTSTKASAAKKATAKKSTARKSSPKKPAAKRTSTKRSTAKKAAARKRSARA